MRRQIWRTTGALVAAAVLTLSGTVPSAGADDPVPPDPTVAPSTSAPPTSAGGVPPSTTAPTSTTTTTTPDSTTTTVPPTTAEPVDDATIEQAAGGFASTPAPLIPSMEDDPLFHAARLVDADLRDLALVKLAHLEQVTATKKVAAAAREARAAYDAVRDVDVDAAERVATSREILRAAALHAYAGYGTAEGGSAPLDPDGSATVSPNHTYVRVTIADATRHVDEAEEERSGTRADVEDARAHHERAQDRLAAARADERATKKAVDDAQTKLDEDRAELREQVGAMADFAPGAFDDLPDVVDLPEGATTVESPVGTIVVPETADERTAIALEFIIAQIGKPYIWGGTGPTGYDCSGLMLRGFQAAGVTSMPRVSQGQQVWATPVEREDLQPGDFVFFGNPAYHIGVYIGGGLMINAPYTGARIRVDRVWSTVTGYGRAVW